MIRRLGRHLLLLSVPLFILLFIGYRNHGQLTEIAEKHDERRVLFDKVIVTRDVEVLLVDTSESVIQKPLVSHTHTMFGLNNLITPLSQVVPVKHYEQANKVSAEKRRLFAQWHVLSDGTVTHRGSEDLHRNVTLLINSHRCTTLRASQSSFVVLVESDIVNFEERQLIRDTWGLSVLQEVGNFRVIFLVGMTHSEDVQSKLDFEQHMYEDMVQIAIYEGFQNLTHKSIHMLHWYTHFCANAKYLFKTDDDIYLHIPNLIHLFANISFDGSILCHHNNSRKILRSLKDIHYFIYTMKDRSKKEVSKQIRNKFQKYLISLDLLPGE